MKVILSLIAGIKSIDLDDGTNLLQTGIKQHHTQPFVFDTDKWQQFDGYYLYDNDGVLDCYPTLPEAIAKCKEAGDCGAVTQFDYCKLNGVPQFRVTHGGPHLANATGQTTRRVWALKSCMQSTGTVPSTGIPLERGLPLLWNGKDYGGKNGEGNCSNFDYGGTTATTTIFDWDAAGWLEEPACYDPAAYNNDCYPTLQAAMDLCDKDAKCTSVQRMSTVCDGQYRLSHAHAVSLHWHQGDIDKNQMVCWTHDKPRAGWTKRVTCYNPGAKENDCYPTLDGAMDLCDKDATCVSVQSMSSVCDGQYRLSNEPIHLHTGASQKVDVERDALVCWTHDNEKTAAEATTTAAAAATTTLTTIPGTIPGENTNVGGTECFGAIATWGPDFECNAKVSSFCADDSADGLDVSACCQDYCSSNQEKRTKKKDSEANSKEAEGERKSKRQESRSKRKDAESARKKQKKEAEWLQKRGAQETSNKKAEDERKTKRGYSESKKKNERKWKANMANAKKAAQLREATRKARRAESAKKNGGGESTKKGQQKEKKQKKKAAWKAKKEKRQKGRGRKGRKGPQVRR